MRGVDCISPKFSIALISNGWTSASEIEGVVAVVTTERLVGLAAAVPVPVGGGHRCPRRRTTSPVAVEHLMQRGGDRVRVDGI